jgi:hypothetical protein
LVERTVLGRALRSSDDCSYHSVLDLKYGIVMCGELWGVKVKLELRSWLRATSRGVMSLVGTLSARVAAYLGHPRVDSRSYDRLL